MSVTESLKNINFSDYSKEFEKFKQESEFIDETLKVLDSDNISFKKNYFLDNQSEIIDTMNNIRKLLNDFDESEIDKEHMDCFILLSSVLKQLEKKIMKFNSELNEDVLSDSAKEDIIITEDTINDAIQNNDGTKQIVENLKNNQREVVADEVTQQIMNNFQELSNQKNNMKQKQKKLPQAGYLITSADLSDYCLVPEVNLSKATLNRLIEESGISSARVFKLSELKTHTKTVQKVVTVLD